MREEFRIRAMTEREVAQISCNWAAKEGWNPGLYDAASFYAQDPEGFLVGELNSRPVATISAVRYDDKFGFLGFYIVKPAYRHHGYGYQIWKAALEHLGDRNIGGDGVLEMIKVRSDSTRCVKILRDLWVRVVR